MPEEGELEESGAEARRRHPAGRPLPDRRDPHRAPQDVGAHQQQIDIDIAPRRPGIDVRQNPRTEDRAEHAGHTEPQHEAPIDVAVIDMRRCRCAGGEDFRRVDKCTRLCRGNSHGQQRGIGEHAIGHAQRTVDELRAKSDRKQQEKFGRHRVSPPE